MNKQKVPIQQIAKIYGWMTSDGSPEVHKVEEELQQPGTHTGGDWLPPVERQYRTELAKRWNRRIPVTDFLEIGEQPKGGAKKDQPEAPESLETLIQQRVPVEQILNMKPSLSREEVELTAAEMGIALPDANYHRPDPAAAEQAETGVRRDPPPGEDREKNEEQDKIKQAAAFVRNLKKQNKSAAEITAKVSEKFPGVDVSGIVG